MFVIGSKTVQTQGSNTDRRLILFTRYPEPGRTKTRLIPALGAEGAADLQQRMSEALVARMREFAADCPVSLEIRYDGGSQQAMESWLPGIPCLPQGDGNLGHRLARAFAQAFAQGAKQVVAIGADCPDLTPAHFAQAFAALDTEALALGPAMDGGYYLIGLNRPAPALFAQIPWGSGEVLSATLKQAQALALTPLLLKPLADVDRPEDLHRLDNHADTTPADSCEISIIIPTLNEEACIGQTLAGFREQPGVEVIVADGGSRDQTAAIAAAAGARVITAPAGRGAQQNAGARVAKGRTLLFLHADTRLPMGFAAHIRTALDQPGVVAGAFRLAVAAKGCRFRLLEYGANWRAARLGLPYGDQALFLPAARFKAMNGFREIALLEDLDLVLRLRKMGRLALIAAPALTSARRWQSLGVARATLINQLILLAFFCGLNPDRLAIWYRRSRNGNGRIFGKQKAAQVMTPNKGKQNP